MPLSHSLGQHGPLQHFSGAEYTEAASSDVTLSIPVCLQGREDTLRKLSMLKGILPLWSSRVPGRLRMTCQGKQGLQKRDACASNAQKALVFTIEGKLPASWHFLPLAEDEGLGNA